MPILPDDEIVLVRYFISMYFVMGWDARDSVCEHDFHSTRMNTAPWGQPMQVSDITAPN